MSNNKHVHDVIGAYIYDALSPDETRQVRDHLDNCVECREDMESQAKVISSIPDRCPSLAELDKERIRWAVRGAVRREPVVVRRSFGGLLRGLSAAAAVACIFAGGIFVGTRLVGTPRQITITCPAAPAVSENTHPVKTPASAKPSRKWHYGGENLAALPPAVITANQPKRIFAVSMKPKHLRKTREWMSLANSSPVKETAASADNASESRPARVQNVAMAPMPNGDNDVSNIQMPKVRGD